MHNAAQPAPVSLCGFLCSLFDQWSPPTHCLVFPPLHVLPSRETWSVRCLFTFFQPCSLQTSHKRSVGLLNFCCPHVWLKSAHNATFMTVLFYCWRLTGSGNLIMWVTGFMNVYICVCMCVWGCWPVSTGAPSVKVSLRCQGLPLLPAGPACHVYERQMER